MLIFTQPHGSGDEITVATATVLAKLDYIQHNTIAF